MYLDLSRDVEWQRSLGAERLHAHALQRRQDARALPGWYIHGHHLYARPLEGQIIAHGWDVTNVAPGENDSAGVPLKSNRSINATIAALA